MVLVSVEHVVSRELILCFVMYDVRKRTLIVASLTTDGSTTLDCIFRCVFGAGFIAILHYLAEASDIVMIKSIQ